MIKVHSIADYNNLPEPQRLALQYSIKCKDRLKDWIRKRNSQPAAPRTQDNHWVRCKRCIEHVGVCACKADGHEGWVEAEPERDNSGVHPSGVTNCLKALYYACSGRASEHHRFVDPDLQFIFDMGHGWHYVVQNFYGKKGAWGAPESYHPEVAIDPSEDGQWVLGKQYWIRGSVDALLDDYRVDVPGMGEVSVRVVHEYKTIGADGYKKLTKPKPEHQWQATIYSAVLDAPLVVFLYVNKNNSQMVDFVVPFNQKLWDEEITKKILAVQSYVTAQSDPPWEITSAKLSPRDCFECGYKNICKPPL